VKLSRHHLAQYITLPDDTREVRALLDDVGVEVKRVEGPADDPVFAVELLANRGDHYCYLGVATEVAGRTGGQVCHPVCTELSAGEPPHPVIVETDLCLVYTLTALRLPEAAAPGALAPEVLRPLEAAGLASVSAPVDATNLVNLEIGQPTHAFDADTIVGPIRVRLSRAGETAWPLFRAERVSLPEGTLVIADDEKILAVAGVIGCEESKTTERTRRVLLESATFDPVSVRKASRALGIHTDSSARFERGADPSAPLRGAGRVVHLLESSTAWRREGASAVVGAWRDEPRCIHLNVAFAARFLAWDLSPGEAAERLSRTGFRVCPAPDSYLQTALRIGHVDVDRHMILQVTVPWARSWDVETEADLLEELAKSIGYNATPELLPAIDRGAAPSEAELAKVAVEEILLSQGFYEVFTDGFYGRALRDQLGITEGHPLFAHVETQNALDRGYSLLKNQALGQAIAAVEANGRRRLDDVRMYEWTRTFHPDPAAPNGVCTERRLLWAVASATDRDDAWSSPKSSFLWLFKGILRELEVELGRSLALAPLAPDAPLATLLHPGRAAAVVLDGAVVGALGELHPRVARSFKLGKSRPVYLEIEADALLRRGARPRFVEPSPHQASVRSLAFTLPHAFEAARVTEALREAGPAWLEAVDVVDVYNHPEGALRSVTWRLQYANDGAERSAEEINAAGEALIAAVEARFGAAGVRLR
jgi:phenylalanyl-tRNA synthetase beta chain